MLIAALLLGLYVAPVTTLSIATIPAIPYLWKALFWIK